MLNVIAIQGRLAADPEMRQTTTGKRVCTFRIACDRGRKDANGNSQTDWIPCTAWEKTAEFIYKYFQKGSMIAVDGRLQSRQYQDKNGQNRIAVEIVANNVNFCGSKESSSPAPQNAAQRPAAPSQRTQGEPDADYATIDDDEGDLPF
jgi:single-strand DNA-binding protein|nr:MAG TPA: Single strand binding protein [Caudoviricetes sp.]